MLPNRLVFLVAALILSACSADDPCNPPGPPEHPSDLSYQHDLAHCVWKARCGFIGASEQRDCCLQVQADHQSYVPAYSADEAVAGGRLAFDIPAAQRCLEAARNAGCTFDFLSVMDDLCHTLFTARVKAAGACQRDSECQAGYCDRGPTTNAGCPGTCRPWLSTAATCDPAAPLCASEDYCDDTPRTCQHRAGGGAPCAPPPSGPRCQSGLFCKGYQAPGPGGPGSMGTCLGRGHAGDPCANFDDETTDCEVGLYCGLTPDNQAACAERQPAGAECSAFWACQDGLSCVGLQFDMEGQPLGSGRCKPYVDAWDLCQVAGDSNSDCPLDMVCGGSDEGMQDRCVPLGEKGDPCSGADLCHDGLYCSPDSSTCTAQIPLGGACKPQTPHQQHPPCHDGQCYQGKCQLMCVGG